jgi:hypothetical protein
MNNGIQKNRDRLGLFSETLTIEQLQKTNDVSSFGKSLRWAHYRPQRRLDSKGMIKPEICGSIYIWLFINGEHDGKNCTLADI